MTLKEWTKYRDLMSQICRKAADEFRDFAMHREGGIGALDRQTVLEYAYALVQKYGQASGELACMFYEQIAQAQNVTIPPAEMAALPEFGEVAKAVNGAIKQTEKNAPGAVERLTKQVGADTMLQNAKRDGAYFAWITSGDTCAYCMMMSAIGWQRAGKKTLSGNHAEHIHAHCDCQYVVDFKGDLKVDGYDPEGMRKDIMKITGSDSGDFNAFLNANGRQTINVRRKGMNALRRYQNEVKRRLELPETIRLENFGERKSVGAKWKNYEILDKGTEITYHLVEGTEFHKVEVFAGKGVRDKLKPEVAEGVAKELKGKPKDIQHVKGFCVLQDDNFFEEPAPAEVHWFQVQGGKKGKFLVKRWLDDWEYDWEES